MELTGDQVMTLTEDQGMVQTAQGTGMNEGHHHHIGDKMTGDPIRLGW